MKVLLLGGTGVLSGPVYEQCAGRGYDTFVLNRGHRPIEGLKADHVLIADLRQKKQVEAALGDEEFDVVVDFLSYTPEQLKNTLEIFTGHMGQYVFISSATAYDIKANSAISENCALVTSGWSYAVNKAICEEMVSKAAHANGFQYTIIRPYVTYGDTRIPFALCKRYQQWSVINRILSDKPILLWDDGKAGCPLTHTSDFSRGVVELLGNPKAYGQAYHITSDEVRNWNEVVSILGQILHKTPQIVYLPTTLLEKAFPEYGKELSGDKARSYTFNNEKIKMLIPAFKCSVSLEEGLEKTIANFQSRPDMRKVDVKWDANVDRVIARYCRDAQVRAKLRYVRADGANKKDELTYIWNRQPILHELTRGAAIAARGVQKIKRLLHADG